MNQKRVLILVLVVFGMVGMSVFSKFTKQSPVEQREQEVFGIPEQTIESDKEVPASSPPVLSGTGEQKDVSIPALQAGETRISIRTRYENPGGFDDIGFNLVIDDEGIITDATVDVLATNEMAKKRQQSFSEAFPQVLKGKKLQEVEELDFVGESSLTTKAFNESLERLKSQL